MKHTLSRYRKTLLATLIPALIPGIAIAEETPLEPVTVTAPELSDSPYSTSLKGDELKSRRATTSDAAKLLTDVPGVSFYGAGGVSSLPAIRGLADDRLRIKVDGMDLIAVCPNHMNPPLSYVTPASVDTIVVHAGVAPVSVGGDSIGGTIQVETFAPEFAAAGQGSITKGEVGAFYRSNGNATGVNLTASHATESFHISYSGSHAQADNYTAAKDFKTNTATGRDGHTLPLDEVGSTAYETNNHALDLAFRNGSHLFEVGVGVQDIPQVLYPNQRMDMLNNDQNRIRLRYRNDTAWGAIDTHVYHERVDHYMDFGPDKRFWYGADSGTGSPCSPLGPTCAAGMPMYSEGETTGAAVKADIIVSQKDLVRAGAELQQYRLDEWWPPSGGGMWPGTFWNINNGERDRVALYGEWERRPDERWMTLLGVRYEQVKTDAGDVTGYNPAGGGNQGRDAGAFNARDRSRTDDNWDFTALARHTPDAMTDIDIGIARKVRSPNLYERYAWSTWAMAAVMNNTVGDGNGYVGNPDLKPEKAHTLSATFARHAPDRSWEFKATPYYTHVEDYIDAVQWDPMMNMPAATPATGKFVVLRQVNQTARLYGIDLSGRMPLGKTAWGEFGLKGLLNYTNGRNTDTDDDLYNIMPLNAKLTLTHKTGGWDNALEVVVVADKDDVSTVRNELATDGYTLVHLRASHSWKQVRLDFGVENLFDEFYSLPTGGAYLGQGRSMSINPTDGTLAWGTAVPGPGRSLYTQLTISF